MVDPQDTSGRPADPAGWASIRRFLPYLWPTDQGELRGRIVGAAVFVALGKAAVLVLPFIYGRAIDAMAHRGEAAMWLAIYLVLAYAGGRFLTVVFDNLRNIIFERVGQNSVRQLTEDVFERLHGLSLRFHLSRRTGEVTKVIERGTKSINSMIYFLLFNIVPTVIELIAVAAIFYFKLGTEMVIATALTVGLYIWLTRQITEWRTHLRKQMNDLDSTALARAVDSLLNYETVKYFGAELREKERFSAATTAYAKAATKSENSLALLNIIQAVLMNLMMGGALAFVVVGWRNGRFTVGDMAMTQMYLTQLFRPLDFLGMVYRTIRQGLIDMAAMFKLIDTSIEVQDAPGAPALVIRKPTVVFDNVVFGYDRDREILHGLSFEVPAGGHVAIVGPSGAGKSTIGRLLFRFYDPWSGRILIDGQDIARVTQESLRAQIGIVPQDSVLFNDTIGYNVAYGRDQATAEDVEAAARGAAIWPFIQRLPLGLDTEVGERGLKLSGGEKQRVAIARTLVKNPPILLLDEATSALDTRTEQDILATLRRVSAHRTSLAIAHRLSTIADADTIFVLNEGRLAESGTHAQLLKRDGLYADMWLRQLADEPALVEAAE